MSCRQLAAHAAATLAERIAARPSEALGGYSEAMALSLAGNGVGLGTLVTSPPSRKQGGAHVSGSLAYTGHCPGGAGGGRPSGTCPSTALSW
eukprot:6572489-Prymnesium_polylepis.1